MNQQGIIDRFNENRVSVSEAHQKFFEIIKEVQETNTRKLITRNGRAIVAISPLLEAGIADDVLASRTSFYNSEEDERC